MAEAAKDQKSPTTNRAQQFGTVGRDSNHQYLGDSNFPYFQDAAASPVKSPVALTTTPSVITVPAAAVRMHVIGAVAIRVGDTSGQTTGYVMVPANLEASFPVITPGIDPNDTTGQIWLAADSTGGNCSFWFDCV